MFLAVLLYAVMGNYICFKKYGMYLVYVGFYPVLVLYRADFVQVCSNFYAF